MDKEYTRDVLDGALAALPDKTFSKGVIPQFSISTRQLKDAAGNLVGQAQVEVVDIIVPGDKLNVPRFKVDDGIRRRFAREYDAFKRGEDADAVGVPLTEWGPTARRPDFIALARVNHCYTVEALAEIPDFALKNFSPDARKLRAQAKAFIEARAVQQPFDEIRAEADQAREETAALRAQLAQLQAMIDARNEDTKRGPGRPRKQPQEKDGDHDDND